MGTYAASRRISRCYEAGGSTYKPSPDSRNASFARCPMPSKTTPWPGLFPIDPSGRTNLVFPLGNSMASAFIAQSWNQPAEVYALTTAMPFPCFRNFFSHGIWPFRPPKGGFINTKPCHGCSSPLSCFVYTLKAGIQCSAPGEQGSRS